MPLNRQLFGRSISEAVADFLKPKYPSAKHLARACDIDPATAENLRKGHVSLATLLKIARVEGRDFWEALGDELYGETLDEYEERKLQAIIEGTENAKRLADERIARRRALEARAHSLDDDRSWGRG